MDTYTAIIKRTSYDTCNQKQESTEIYQNVFSLPIVLTFLVSEKNTVLTSTQYVFWLLHNEETVLQFHLKFS